MSRAKKKKSGVPPAYIETAYGTVQIEETTSRGEPVRLYRHNGAFSSGTFLREEKKFEDFASLSQQIHRDAEAARAYFDAKQ